MPWYIKTERFKKNSKTLPHAHRKDVIIKHRTWVEDLSKKGLQITSGYLVNEKKAPGGGGLLIFNANSYKEARLLVEQDPMILAKLVDWELQEWTYVSGNMISLD